MAMIEMRKIEGADVYGVEQCSYVVDGQEGRDYTAALAAAALKQTVAVEADLAAMSTVCRARQVKLSDLNLAMTYISTALGTLPDTDSGGTPSAHRSDKMDELRDAAELAWKYRINVKLVGDDGNQIERGTGQTVSATIKHELDLEGNALQQDVVSLQNLITKRDSTYQTVFSLVKRSLNAGATAIKGLGK